jgi:hypothetical protein
MNIEITINELLNDYDWAHVFADASYGNTTKDVDSPDGTSLEPFTRCDVEEILAAANGYNDGDSWCGLFVLNDGRYLAASGTCDYTGWDCQAGNTLTVAATADIAARFGLTDSERERLGIELN